MSWDSFGLLRTTYVTQQTLSTVLLLAVTYIAQKFEFCRCTALQVCGIFHDVNRNQSEIKA